MRFSAPARFRCAVWSLALAISTLGAVGPSAVAAASTKTALDWIGADAAFFSASFDLGDQWRAALASKAVKKLWQLPAVQMGWAALQLQLAEPEGPAKLWQDFLKDADNRELLDLARELVDREVFVSGERSAIEFIRLAAQFSGSISGGASIDPTDPESGPVRAQLEFLRDNIDLLAAPDILIGFRIQNADRAKRQLARLEKLGEALGQQVPSLAGRVARKSVGKGEYLTLHLDGSLLPIKTLELERLSTEPDEFAPLVERLRSLSLDISVGLREGYLLLAIGGSVDNLARLGAGTPLAERSELAHAVRAFGSERVVGVNYISREMRAQLSTTPQEIDDYREKIVGYLGQMGLPDNIQQRVNTDLSALADDLKSYLPAVGPQSEHTTWTDEGFESYAYDWSELLGSDGSKPLSLLRHLGAAPIAAYLHRAAADPRDYEIFVKWMQVFYGYVDDFLLPMMDDDEQHQFREAERVGLRLLARLDRANRELILPALADGQTAVVLDAKIKSRAWQAQMPPSSAELPMLELALVFGVSDADKLRQGAAEYFSVCNEAIRELAQLFPDALPPDFQLPPPVTKAIANGTLYMYPLLGELGVDQQIAPNVGLGVDALVLSFSPRQSESILTPGKLDRPGLLDAQRPLVSASYFDFPSLLGAVAPWVEWGMTAAMDDPAATERGSINNMQLNFALSTVRGVLEVLGCIRGTTSISYLEDGVLVTRSQFVIKDIP